MTNRFAIASGRSFSPEPAATARPSLVVCHCFVEAVPSLTGGRGSSMHPQNQDRFPSAPTTEFAFSFLPKMQGGLKKTKKQRV